MKILAAELTGKHWGKTLKHKGVIYAIVGTTRRHDHVVVAAKRGTAKPAPLLIPNADEIEVTE
jgi:ribosomal protein L18